MTRMTTMLRVVSLSTGRVCLWGGGGGGGVVVDAKWENRGSGTYCALLEIGLNHFKRV